MTDGTKRDKKGQNGTERDTFKLADVKGDAKRDRKGQKGTKRDTFEITLKKNIKKRVGNKGNKISTKKENRVSVHVEKLGQQS